MFSLVITLTSHVILSVQGFKCHLKVDDTRRVPWAQVSPDLQTLYPTAYLVFPLSSLKPDKPKLTLATQT